MEKIRQRLSAAGIDGFILAILFMVVLAYIFPAPGLAERPISLEELIGYGVSGIFFFYGLKLNFDKLRTGLANWKLHVVIQCTTFLLFPMVALLVRPLFHGQASQQLWAGIFYLCALPSTVSSSVVMVSMARGNIAAAIFNASISSLIGIFATPFWVKLFMEPTGDGFENSQIMLKLFLQVLAPVLLGIALNHRFGAFAETHKRALKNFDQGVILVIIYTSFCKSFSLGLFKDISWLGLAVLSAEMLGLFAAVMLAVRYIARLLGFGREDRITAMFCGSKKSLVHGTVMSRILFAGSSMAGIILLPLMLYHALQLIAASILARKMAAEEEGQ